MNAHPSVLSWPDVLGWREAARVKKQRVVLTNGVFDLLHRGHLEYLRQSASMGDLLLVAINSDESVRTLKGPNRPINSESDRAFAVACLRFVAASFVFPGPRLAHEIATIKPDVYTKAGDYTRETLDASERTALESAGVDIRFMPFVSGHSTTQTIQRLHAPSQR